MNWKVLKTEDDYNKASIRMMEIFNAEPNTPESDELDLLIVLVKDYDEKHYQLPQLDALEVIKYKMQEMGIKAKPYLFLMNLRRACTFMTSKNY